MEELFIQLEEAVAVLLGTGADQMVGQYMARRRITLLSSSNRGSLKRAADW